MPFWLKLCPGFLEPNLCEKNEFEHPRTNPDQAMASSATSATSFELIEDQTLTAEEVEMASQEAQEIRTREAAVAAGLVLDEPEAPPSASATDVMKDLSNQGDCPAGQAGPTKAPLEVLCDRRQLEETCAPGRGDPPTRRSRWTAGTGRMKKR